MAATLACAALLGALWFGEHPKEKTLVEGQVIDARGKLAGPVAGKRLDVLEWSPAPPPASQP